MITTTINLYRNAYSGLTRRIWLLSAVMLINRCGTMVLPFMTLYCHHLGYTERQGGIAVAAYGVGSMVGAWFGGKLSDKIGFYTMQFIALFGGGVMFLVLGQMHSYNAILLCVFFTSMINESFRPANSSAIAHYSTPQNRTQSFSLIRLAINLGWGVGSALAGLLSSISYHLLFWADGLTNITAAFVLLLVLPKVTLEQQHRLTHENHDETTPVRGPFQDKTFMWFTFFMLLFSICFFQLFTTVPLFFKEGFHLNEDRIGLIMSMNGILIALFEMIIVFKLEGTRPYLRLMMYGCILLASSFAILNIPSASYLLLATIAMVVVTVAEITGMPFMNSYYISRTTAANRGRYAAIYTMTWSAAQVIGSLSGTQMAHAFGYFTLWWVLGGISILAGLGFNSLKEKP
ncbi:MAG: MFS transporter [Bacteroidetes bacterium]|nr:MFS transporter [Bacteroidota bacterium]